MDQSHLPPDIGALEQAVEFMTAAATTKPNAQEVVDALVVAEKRAKQSKEKYVFEQLLGRWRLGFITGTKKTRQRAGVALGAGRFLPPWIQIQIIYTNDPLSADSSSSSGHALDIASEENSPEGSSHDVVDADSSQETDQGANHRGTVVNTVKLSGLKFALSGPIQFWAKQNILAFDFTRMTVQLFGQTLFNGKIRQGDDREQQFYQQTLKEQAFFAYFGVQDNWIAARGRGGGLAVWTRVQDESQS